MTSLRIKGWRIGILSVVALACGLLGGVSMLVYRWDSYETGIRMESVGSLWGIAALFTLIGLVLIIVGLSIIAMVVLVWKRRVQELAAVTSAVGLIACARMIPMPSHMDGIVVALGRQDIGSYADISKWLRKRSADEKGPQDAPSELLTKFPGLSDVFDPFPNPKLPLAIRYEIDPGYVTVWTGGSLGGHRGFRFYDRSDFVPPLPDAPYRGSLQPAGPKLYAYLRHF